MSSYCRIKVLSREVFHFIFTVEKAASVQKTVQFYLVYLVYVVCAVATACSRKKLHKVYSPPFGNHTSVMRFQQNVQKEIVDTTKTSD